MFAPKYATNKGPPVCLDLGDLRGGEQHLRYESCMCYVKRIQILSGACISQTEHGNSELFCLYLISARYFKAPHCMKVLIRFALMDS